MPVRHGQTPARRLHLPVSECSGAPDGHQFHRSSRREPAQTPPGGIMSGLTSAATGFTQRSRRIVRRPLENPRGGDFCPISSQRSF